MIFNTCDINNIYKYDYNILYDLFLYEIGNVYSCIILCYFTYYTRVVSVKYRYTVKV